MLSKHLGPQRQQLPKKNSSYHLPRATTHAVSGSNEREREKSDAKYHFLTIYKALGNEFALCIYILNFLWSNVLSLCQLENVFLPKLIAKYSKNLHLLKISITMLSSQFNQYGCLISYMSTAKFILIK